MIDQDLLDILVCPACGEGARLSAEESDSTLACDRCGRRYPVCEGIPVLLVEEARLPGTAPTAPAAPPAPRCRERP